MGIERYTYEIPTIIEIVLRIIPHSLDSVDSRLDLLNTGLTVVYVFILIISSLDLQLDIRQVPNKVGHHE